MTRGPLISGNAMPGTMTADGFEFPVVLAGGAARHALADGAAGRAIAVFRRSFYVEAAGGLACIGPAGLGAGPLNVLCDLPDRLDWEASGVTVGARAHAGGGRLTVAGRFVFDLARAGAWRPPPVAAEWRRDVLTDGLEALVRAASSFDGDRGLGAVIGANAGDRDAEDPLLRAARPAIAALEDWLSRALSSGAGGPPTVAAQGLIGLGPGLTPSGDDFIGGAMIVLHGLGRSDVAARLADWALPLAVRRTGKISAAHLACAAAGEGAAALHAAIGSLCIEGAPGLVQCLHDIDAIGHSSGWDALAGAACAMAALCAARC